MSTEWAAGVIDAIGRITYMSPGRGRGKRLYLIVCSANDVLIERLCATLGVGCVIERNDNSYEWRVSGEAAADLLVRLLPMLVAKRTDALVALDREGFEWAGIAVDAMLEQRILIRPDGSEVDVPLRA